MKKILYFSVFLSSIAIAQAQSLKDLLERAERNYPLLKAKRLESDAGAGYVRYMKSTALPSLDAGYQLNYATYNNITGMAVPQSFVPISGPPSASNSSNAVFGSVAGLLMNWDLFTSGQRRSAIHLAEASLEYRKADEAHEVFQHQVRTANAYLDLLISNELVKVYLRNLLRSEDNLRIVRSLARSGLRPGVDTAQFLSELAKAKIALLNHEKMRQAQQLLLSELLGEQGIETVSVDTTFFTRLPVMPGPVDSVRHPLIDLSSSKLRISEFEKKSLQRSLYPKLSFWGTAYGRGSGIRYDDYVNSEDGLSLSRYNYGAGLVLSVPLLQFTRTRYQIRAQDAKVQAGQERVNAARLQIAKQKQLADVTLSNALTIANESPAFFEASLYAYRGLMSRYNSGLLNYTELIQAQYALLESEAELKKAYVEAWKALLYLSAVNGDLNLFTNEL